MHPIVIQTPPPVPVPPSFDPNLILVDVVPLIAVLAAIVASAFVLKWLFRSPVGEAIAERIRIASRRRRHWKGLGGEWVDVPGDAPVDEPRVAALEEQVTQLRGELSELAERLDFAERLLAERRGQRLGAGQ